MKIKKFSLILAIIMLANVFCLTAFAAGAEGQSWYVKRSGNKRPTLSQEQIIIEKYDAYYIDNKLTDDSDKKVIYLTFDAGYENGNTERILDTLMEKKVPAAFFLLDNIILKNTDLVKRMADEGHLVCNHTKNHIDLTQCTNEQITKNLSDLEKIYEEKTGNTMSKYFRFPEGKYNEPALSHIQSLGYKTIFWSFGYADWDNQKQPQKDAAIKKILENTHNGAVILLHPTSKTNADIMPILIDKWREMGYEFGTLDQLTA